MHAPIEQREFDEVVARVLARRRRCLGKPLTVKSKGSIVVIEPNRINFIESNRRKLVIHIGKDAVETYGVLECIRRELPNSFIQCHKSFLVNMDYIAELRSERIRLMSGDVVPVSQKRRKTVKDAFAIYMQGSL